MYKLRNNLKGLMDDRGLTQKQLADAMGVTPGTISRWVRNQVDLYDKELLEKFLNFFDCELSDILIRERINK